MLMCTVILKIRCKVFRSLMMYHMGDGRVFSEDLGSMRKPYLHRESMFSESSLIAKEPIGQFKGWFDEACNNPQILEANAMCLSTCSREGYPSARYVLLKGYGTEGFKFYTNYDSRKGRELAENPYAALTFYWEPLKRQIRIEGVVQKLSDEESDNYFHSRPRSSQIGACISNQSTVIAGRQVLTQRENELTQQYANESTVIPRPACWGGFIVIPHTIEFWQGQSDRLHDRIRFRRPRPNEKTDGYLLHEGVNNWVFERLAP